MLTKISRFKDRLVYGIPVALTTFMLGEMEALAAGGKGIGSVAGDVNKELEGVSDLIVAGSFLGGLVMSAAGLVKLKAAADTQGQQVPYSQGLWRLGVGSCLVAVPGVIKMGVATTGMEVSTGGLSGSGVK